jgi:hypothetical protein
MGWTETEIRDTAALAASYWPALTGALAELYLKELQVFPVRVVQRALENVRAHQEAPQKPSLPTIREAIQGDLEPASPRQRLLSELVKVSVEGAVARCPFHGEFSAVRVRADGLQHNDWKGEPICYWEQMNDGHLRQVFESIECTLPTEVREMGACSYTEFCDQVEAGLIPGVSPDRLRRAQAIVEESLEAEEVPF